MVNLLSSSVTYIFLNVKLSQNEDLNDCRLQFLEDIIHCTCLIKWDALGKLNQRFRKI